MRRRKLNSHGHDLDKERRLTTEQVKYRGGEKGFEPRLLEADVGYKVLVSWSTLLGLLTAIYIGKEHSRYMSQRHENNMFFSHIKVRRC